VGQCTLVGTPRGGLSLESSPSPWSRNQLSTTSDRKATLEHFFDQFGNDRRQVRVPYEATTKDLDESDRRRLRFARPGGLGYAAARPVNLVCHVLAISDAERDVLERVLDDAGANLSALDARSLAVMFVLLSLCSAALGDGETHMITGEGRDEFFLTQSRIYFRLKTMAEELGVHGTRGDDRTEEE